MTSAIVLALVVAAGSARSITAQDVASRRAAIIAIERSSRSLPDVEMFGPVAEGLWDPDDTVARMAAVTLNHLLRDPRSGQPRSDAFLKSMAESPALMQRITDCMHHPTEMVKAACVDAILTLPRPLSSQVLGDLAVMGERDADEVVRRRIVTLLPERAQDMPVVTTMLVAALRDRSPGVQRSAALTVARLRPPAALPIIAEDVAVAQGEKQRMLVDVLVTYGDAAKPYVGVLQGLLATETDNARRDVLQRAIRRISGESR
jgi:hypothetical protein